MHETTNDRDARTAGPGPVAQLWPHLNLLGMGAWWAWIWLCYSSTRAFSVLAPEVQPSAVRMMYLGSTLGIGFVMALAALWWRRATRVVDDTRVVCGLGIVAGVATALLAPAWMRLGGVGFQACAFATGACTSILCLRSGRLYGTLGLDECLTSGGIMLVFAALLYFAGVNLPPLPGIAYLALLPPLSAALMSLPDHDAFAASGAIAERPAERHSPSRRVFRHILVTSCCLAFTASVGRGVASGYGSPEAFAGNGMVCIAVVALLAVALVVATSLRGAVWSVRNACMGLMVLGMAVLLGSCLGLPLTYLSISKETLWLVFSCVMAYLAFRFDDSAVRLFGMGQAAYFVSTTLGWAVGGLVAPHYGEETVRVVTGAGGAFLLALAMAYGFTRADANALAKQRDVLRTHEPPAPSPACAGCAQAAAQAQALERAVSAATQAAGAGTGASQAAGASGAQAGGVAVSDETARAYGLSAREVEILLLFAQGRSANWIADSLTISNNTVRSHLRAIYVKLDVHTRQELIDFLAAQ